MNLDEFIAKWNGKRITAPGGLGGECVDLANQYILDCFGDPHEWKNAIDWFGASPDKFDWVTNDPHNFAQIPPRGALMVWGPGPQTGPNGQHIDVVVTPSRSGFTGFDQNWPIGSPAHLVAHTYIGIKGWGIPKQLEQAAIDAAAAAAAAAAQQAASDAAAKAAKAAADAAAQAAAEQAAQAAAAQQAAAAAAAQAAADEAAKQDAAAKQAAADAAAKAAADAAAKAAADAAAHHIQPPVVPASVPDEIASLIQEVVMTIVHLFHPQQ